MVTKIGYVATSPQDRRCQWVGHFERSELAQRYLQVLTMGAVQSFSLKAPVGKWKTQIICRDLLPNALQWGFDVIYRDMADATEAVEMVQQIIENGRRSDAMALQTSEARAVHVAGCVKPAWHYRLLRHLAGERPLLLLLDEFSILAQRPNGLVTLRHLSALLGRHTHRLRAVVTGPSRSALNKIFLDWHGPFYTEGYGVYEFPVLGGPYLEWLCQAWQASDKSAPSSKEISAAFARLHYAPGALRSCLTMISDGTVGTLSEAIELIERSNRSSNAGEAL
jgi:hypothetical protein